MAFDVGTPSPDDGHEAIRLAVVQAIKDGQAASSGVDDAYWITDLLLGMATDLYSQCADLGARVEALEAAAVPPTNPTQ